MKCSIYRFSVFFAAVLVLSVTCGKKGHIQQNLVVIGSDTLTMSQISELDPVIAADSIRLRNVLVRLACAGRLPVHTDSTAALLAERLSLHSGVEWSEKAAELLRLAADSLITRSIAIKECLRICRAVDSMVALYATAVNAPHAPFNCVSPDCTTITGEENNTLILLIMHCLGIQEELASTVVDFVHPPKAAMVGVLAEDVVKGLVLTTPPPGRNSSGTSSTIAEKHLAGDAPKPETQDNSVVALRYRTQTSIRDTIEKHIPNIKSLYRKTLKTDATLSGSVVVAIRVAASGEVLSAHITKSAITNQQFLDPFLTYLKTVRFLPIPLKVGNMTFEFPFEFDREM